MTQPLLTDEQRRQAVALLAQKRAAREPPTVIAKGVQIAAMFLLEVSYGQLCQLFNVSTSKIYVSTLKYIPPATRAKRQPKHGKPTLSMENASMYYEALEPAIRELGTAAQDPVTLAVKLKELTAGMDWTE